MELRNAIFDMDGTLLDSTRIWFNLGVNTLIDMGYQPAPDLNDRMKVLTMRQGAAYCKKAYDLPISADEFADRMESRVHNFYYHQVQPKPGVVAFLTALKEQNIPMYVATATDRALTEAALRHAGVYDFFQGIVTCSDVGHGKDSPLIFECAMDRMGADRESTLIFEDALHAIETAKSAGFHVAAIYDEASKDDQERIRSLADYYVRSFEDLPLSTELPHMGC